MISKNLRLRDKFFIYLILLIFISMIGLTVPYYIIFKNTSLRNAEVYSTNLADQLTSSISFVTGNLEEQVLRQIQGRGTAQRIWNLTDQNDASMERHLAVEDLFLNILYPSTGIEEVYFLPPWDRFYWKSLYGTIPEERINMVYSYAVKNKNHIEEYWEEFAWKSFPEYPDIIYMSAAVYQKNIIEPVGILTVGISKQYLESFFRGYDASKGGDILVFNREEEPVYTNRDELKKTVLPLLEVPEGPRETVIKGGFHITWDASRDMRLIICHAKSLSILQEQVGSIRQVILIVSGIVLLLALFSAYSMARLITNRLSLLVDKIDYIRKGHFDMRIPRLGNDEIGELGEAFNSMNENLTTTLMRLAEDEAKIRETDVRLAQAEYTSLQSQINPHFLYNTLETVNSLAKLRGVEEIAELVAALARLFRKNVRTSTRTIPFKEEIAYVKDYLFIQKTLMAGRLDAEFDIGPELHPLEVPRFCLQPIVENSIKHGLEQTREGGLVLITAYIEKSSEKFIIEISDNGSGIGMEALAVIRSRLEREELSSHVGLASVHRRILLLYGADYGLSIRGEPGIGTVCTLTLPRRKWEKTPDGAGPRPRDGEGAAQWSKPRDGEKAKSDV